MKKRNLKPIIALVLVAVIGTIGTTFAYFTSSNTLTNIFKTKPYSVSVVNTFMSPDDWVPGTTTPLTVTATNNGDVLAAVRISYEESWKDANGATLPLSTGGEAAAVINFLGNRWIESVENGKTYYYYDVYLEKGDDTHSLTESVTFNPNVPIDTDSDCTTDTTTGVTTCNTVTSGYAGGTYTLTFTVETAQYDQYKTIWSTNVEITEPR